MAQVARGEGQEGPLGVEAQKLLRQSQGEHLAVREFRVGTRLLAKKGGQHSLYKSSTITYNAMRKVSSWR